MSCVVLVLNLVNVVHFLLGLAICNRYMNCFPVALYRACVYLYLRFDCVRRVCVICQCVSANVFGHCMHSFVFSFCCVVFFKCMNVKLVSRLIAICVLWV